jgi:hypothetical protein
VLTTTPGRDCEGVEPVDVDVASEPVVCSGVVAASVSVCACVESDAVVSDEDDSEVDESGVSAHATPHP